MKKFDFPLGRVMDFRRMQARLEEIKLEGMYAELRAIDTREAELQKQTVDAEKALRAARSVTGFDLQMLDNHREAAKEERAGMEKTRAECRKKIAAQLHALTLKKRDVKLLEQLKDQRLEKWEKEMLKEIDQQVEEAYLAKWARMIQRP